MHDESFSYPPITPSAVRDYYEEFVQSLSGRRPETRDTYKRTLREFVKWYSAESGFSRAEVEQYKKHLVEDKRLSAVSVSAYLTSLRQFCEYLVGRKLLPSNPARDVGGNGRPVAHSREVLTADAVEKLLASIPCQDEIGSRDFAIAKLMVECGLTEIEVIRSDVRDARMTGGANLLMVRGKGKDSKESVALTEGAARSLQSYLSFRGMSQPEEPLFRSAGNRTRGMRMTTRGIRSRMNHYLETAGIKQGRARRITPHSLRHTCAVMMADAGATPDEIRRRLRLGTLATAMLYVNRARRRTPETSTSPSS